MRRFPRGLGVVASLRRLRKRRGLTQTQLATRARTTQAAISLLERGRRSPTLRTLEQLALALKVRPSELLASTEYLIRSRREGGHP